MPLKTDGAKLREVRERKAITLTEFARGVGYSLNHCSQVELGHNNASPRFLRSAATFLGCAIEDITDGIVPSHQGHREAS